MNGAVSMIQTLVNGGVDVCFTNPGTSEMHFVAAVDAVDGMRTILCLFEGVCTGAADGYARMTGKPATTLLHLGPGLGNAYANAHNARKAHTPLINIVGEHATWHLEHNAPLTADIEATAAPISDWVRTIQTSTDVPADTAAAIQAAMQPPGQIATLILPGDCAWNESIDPQPAPTLPQPAPFDPAAVERAAEILLAAQKAGEPAVLFLEDAAMSEQGTLLASRIANATGARPMSRTANARVARGAGRPKIEAQPYPVAQALASLDGTKHMIFAGPAGPPVAFFGYPNKPSIMAPPDCQYHHMVGLNEDILGALEALAEAVNAPTAPAAVYERSSFPLPSGSLDPAKVWAIVTHHMPDNAIIVDEAVTSRAGAQQFLDAAPPYDLLNVTGGSIGMGLPCAVGAAVACPNRKVIGMQADGSAMYTVQALWTQARENLDVTTVLFNNSAYAILQGELKNVGAAAIGPKAEAMLDLGDPEINWTRIAEGMGVPATRCYTAEEFNRQFPRDLYEQGPRLIEVMI